MEILGKTVALLALGLVEALIGGWGIATLWGWFITPVFGGPTVTLWYGYGIKLIFMLLVPINWSNADSEMPGWVRSIVGITVVLMVVSSGWIVKALFIG